MPMTAYKIKIPILSANRIGDLINQRFCLDQRTSMLRKRIYVISVL